MSSERRPRAGQDGFTLIEVMVAMVILAIGLLGLEALGIGAARSIALAEDRSDYTMLAMRRMEDTMRGVRLAASTSQPLQGSSGTDADTGLWYEAEVETTDMPADVAKITVRVRDSESSPKDAFVVSSYVYHSGITP